ncbi:hypothetical protein V8E36_006940 [Tilletia maclaganii]
MPRVPPVYPPPGVSPVADAIRARRGARGLTPLDGTLLQSPAYAAGWNALLGAVRTGTSEHLPADVREIIILRIAARNSAAFEWLQHEPVARNEGQVGDEVLRAVRLTGLQGRGQQEVVKMQELVPPAGPLSQLQAAAVVFTDESTLRIQVQDATFQLLRDLLLAEHKGRSSHGEAGQPNDEEDVIFADRAIVEATATASTYNMVSRFLVALDVDGRSQQPVPIPGPPLPPAASTVDPVSRSSSSAAPTQAPATRAMVQTSNGQVLATLLHSHTGTSPRRGTIICINSLMTDLSMWTHVLPDLQAHFDVITYDQRGHGLSSIPPAPCDLAQLADDTAAVLSAYGVQRAHAVLGVSQGGATALAFLLRHSERAGRFVVCDTQAKSPQPNRQAWDDRIALVKRAEQSGGAGAGMRALAEVTLPRWFSALFPTDSSSGPDSGLGQASDDRRSAILQHTASMIEGTLPAGFEAGARALQDYDLLDPPPALATRGLLSTLRESNAPVLLLAGANDGALPGTLRKLADDAVAAGASQTRFAEIPDAGHLPMIDQPRAWAETVLPFLLS